MKSISDTIDAGAPVPAEATKELVMHRPNARGPDWDHSRRARARLAIARSRGGRTRSPDARVRSLPQLAAERSPDVLHGQEELQGVDRRRLEVEALIERAGGLVFGIDQQRASPDDLAPGVRTDQSVPQQDGAQSQALEGAIDSQASQDHHRDWMASESLSDSRRGLGRLNAAGGEGVVASRSPSLRDNVGLGGIGALVRQRVVAQPFVQARPAAAEV